VSDTRGIVAPRSRREGRQAHLTKQGPSGPVCMLLPVRPILSSVLHDPRLAHRTNGNRPGTGPPPHVSAPSNNGRTNDCDQPFPHREHSLGSLEGELSARQEPRLHNESHRRRQFVKIGRVEGLRGR
jgi:hypothetical protein